MPIDAEAGARTRSRSSWSSLAPWAVASWFLAAGCIVDGQYLIKGRVVGWKEGAQVPLENAKVSIRHREGAASTAADGSFQLRCNFGGVMPFVWSDGHPVVEVRSAGYRTCQARIRSDSVTPGVTRGRCPENPGCFTIEVLLAPEDGASTPATAATCR